jgi:hypothetical protein
VASVETSTPSRLPRRRPVVMPSARKKRRAQEFDWPIGRFELASVVRLADEGKIIADQFMSGQEAHGQNMGDSNSCPPEVRTRPDNPKEHRHGIHQKPSSRRLDPGASKSLRQVLITLKHAGVQSHKETLRRERLPRKFA